MRWLKLDSNDNINISVATEIGSYICDADREVYATIYAKGLAGGGDYVYYATVTPFGLSAGEALKTTQTLGATTYQLFAQTMPISLRNGDVLKIYIDGLAGDTTTPDTRVNFYEDNALQPTIAGRTLDVDANGGAEVGSFQSGAIDADAIATDAITADKIAAAAIGTNEAPLLANLDAAVSSRSTLTAAQVWAYATRTLTSFGTLVADIWAYASRTLTMTGEAILAVVTGNAITIQRGDDTTISLTVGALTDYDEVWFTVKTNRKLDDNKALIQITESGGLEVFQGEAVSGAGMADADLTVDDKSTGAITITISNARTKLLDTLRAGVADVQMRDSNGVVTTKKNYIVTINEDVTRSV